MRTVFVVDDHRLSADTLGDILQSEGYNTCSFYSPFAVVEAAKTMPPDTLITDFSMPGMDGLTLALCLRGQNPGCNVIVISGDVGAVRGHPASHLFPVLEKPVEIGRLLDLIRLRDNNESQPGAICRVDLPLSSLAERHTL
ncbi:MAG: response regulator [Candidatus Korobacteraceae bacterium]|jgi:DNA-binding NtrC family response regulator